MAKQVEDVYGNALFELAVEEKREDEFLEEAKVILTAFEENPELIAMMTHPQIGEEEKLSVLETIFKGRISDEIYGLIVMIAEKGHFADAPRVFSHFIDRIKEYRNIGVAYVQTAMELDASHKKAVEEKLLETTDYVSLEIHYSVDSSLIGGMTIRIGDRVVDSSIRTKLERLSQQLTSGR
jgi:F-type H+-transporting ATPase subunit delta